MSCTAHNSLSTAMLGEMNRSGLWPFEDDIKHC